MKKKKGEVLERPDLGNGMGKFSWLDLVNKRRKPKAIGHGKRDVPSYSDGGVAGEQTRRGVLERPTVGIDMDPGTMIGGERCAES